MKTTCASRLALLAIVQLCLLCSAAGQTGHKCSGMGKRFCNGANFDAEECPRPCNRRVRAAFDIADKCACAFHVALLSFS